MSISNISYLKPINGNTDIEAVDDETESSQKVVSDPDHNQEVNSNPNPIVESTSSQKVESNQSLEVEKFLKATRDKQSRDAYIKHPVDLNQVVTKLKVKEVIVSQWQTKLIKLCDKINDRLKPRLKNLEGIGEELIFPVIECKSGQSDNLVGAWLMTIRLAIGKIQFPAGNNDTVAKECWEKLSTLAYKTVLAIQTHKTVFKPTVRQLEFVRDKYVKYVHMVGRPAHVDSLPKKVTNKDLDSMEHSIPDRYIQGVCSASVAVFERDIILVHDQDKSAPIFHIKDSAGTGNYSRCIEILKLFIDQTTGMISRSHEKMLSEEKEQKHIPQFLRNEMAELLALCLKYDQAHRLQERLCASSLKITMRSLNETIRSFLNHTEEIKLMYIWVLTAVEACFNKIKESWPSINFTAEQRYRDKYQLLFQSQSQRNPWWHPKRFFGTSKFTFWEDISENVGKFEKYFRRWGTENLHLINLRVSIPVELSSLLFVENGRGDLEYLDSPGNEFDYQMKSFYSEIFLIEAQNSPPPGKGRRHHLSHTNTSVEDIELDLDEHANHPTIDHDDLFPCVNESEETSEENSEPKSDPSSFLTSPTFSVASNTVQNKVDIISNPASEIEVSVPTVSVLSNAKSVQKKLEIISSPVSETEISEPTVSILSRAMSTQKKDVTISIPASETEVSVPTASVVSSAKSVQKTLEIISSPVSETEMSEPTVSILSRAMSTQKKGVTISIPASETEISEPTVSILSRAKSVQKTFEIISMSVSEAEMSETTTVSVLPSAKPVHKTDAIISGLPSETDISCWDSARSVGITTKSSLSSLK